MNTTHTLSPGKVIMKQKPYPLIFACAVILFVLLAACSTTDDVTGKAVGKWETFYIQTDGYGTKLDMRVTMQMKRSGQCVQRIYSVLSGKLYEELDCSYGIKDDNITWISYANGQMLQMGFEGDQLVIFNARGVMNDTGPHVRYERMK